ncbi:Krueppel-like factor 13 [Corvus kubaryi]|uniref:Krueppel-like factor 13 n=1 Tax=Corvus kubaryi TaxID=68294 RepID=UPI001C04288F|nr:Krueppel-like factor 13 [Corvus kubaryi]
MSHIRAARSPPRPLAVASPAGSGPPSRAAQPAGAANKLPERPHPQGEGKRRRGVRGRRDRREGSPDAPRAVPPPRPRDGREGGRSRWREEPSRAPPPAVICRGGEGVRQCRPGAPGAAARFPAPLSGCSAGRRRREDAPQERSWSDRGPAAGSVEPALPRRVSLAAARAGAACPGTAARALRFV